MSSTSELIWYMGREMVLCWVQEMGKGGVVFFSGFQVPQDHLLIYCGEQRERHPKNQVRGVGSRVKTRLQTQSRQSWGWARWQDEGSGVVVVGNPGR